MRLICSSAISSVYAAAIAAAAIAADQEKERRSTNRRKEEVLLLDFGAVGVVVPAVEDNLNSASTMDCLSCEWEVEGRISGDEEALGCWPRAPEWIPEWLTWHGARIVMVMTMMIFHARVDLREWQIPLV